MRDGTSQALAACTGPRLAVTVSSSLRQLRAALDAFAAMDLTAWTQRAADELAATGATARPRRPLASEPLTSQETRVALLMARARAVQPRGRRRPVPQPQDGRAPPSQRVPQTRLPLPHRAGRRHRQGRGAGLRGERAPDVKNLSHPRTTTQRVPARWPQPQVKRSRTAARYAVSEKDKAAVGKPAGRGLDRGRSHESSDNSSQTANHREPLC